MAVSKQNYDILISIDAGYNGSKVTVNGVMFQIPADIVEITGRQYVGNIRKPGYICSTYIQDTNHLVGEQARMLIMEPEYKEKMSVKLDMMESYEKFNTTDAKIHLMTCIGMALIKYSQYTMEHDIKPQFDVRKVIDDESSQFKIWVIVGYPHDVYSQVFRAVKPEIARRHAFNIETEDNSYDLDFTIDNERIMTYSQAMALYMGLISDDEGNIDYNSRFLQNMPTIGLDGGQKTVGISKITSNMQIESAESNTDFAMHNVYLNVVKILQEEYGRTDIEDYNIPNILNKENGEIVVLNKENNKTNIVDIKPIVENEIDAMCEKLIKYLEGKYNQLLDIKQIVVGGGTGLAYYEGLSRYVREHREHLADRLVLAEYKFNGQEVDAVFSISVGLYKVLKHSVKKYTEEMEARAAQAAAKKR